MTTNNVLLDVTRIMEMIPHRYPMLLIDRVIAADPNESCTALKNVTINESFFQGHFPGAPVMPGVLIIEAMAQTAAALVVHSAGKELEGKLVYFMAIDGAILGQLLDGIGTSTWSKSRTAEMCGNSRAKPASAKPSAPRPKSRP